MSIEHHIQALVRSLAGQPLTDKMPDPVLLLHTETASGSVSLGIEKILHQVRRHTFTERHVSPHRSFRNIILGYIYLIYKYFSLFSRHRERKFEFPQLRIAHFENLRQSERHIIASSRLQGPGIRQKLHHIRRCPPRTALHGR